MNIFKDKIILITGGTGSFGNSVVKRFLQQELKEIRIFSRDEKKQEDMRVELNNPLIRFCIGDVRDYDSTFQATKDVDYIFHAAALKQVPSCEFYPMEAVKTNIIGTQNVIDCAIKNSVKKVIILSTDKAVYPINAMGMTKAIAEKLMISRSRSLKSTDTIFCATRYGNVMASRGSVIPLFVSQIKASQHITITDPEMTRFLMTLEESVNLVEYAFKNGNQGDIFVQKAPASTIIDLANALKNLFESNISIKKIGTRHGEKLFETLISREEMVMAFDEGSYFRIPADNRDMNYANYFTLGNNKISVSDDFTSHNTKRLNINEIKEMLLKIDYIQKELCD